MFPNKFCACGFEIVPYDGCHDMSYIRFLAPHWHILLPDDIKFETDEQREKYSLQFNGFCNEVLKNVHSDIESGKYRDYTVLKNKKPCGIIDVSTIHFDNPEVGIILDKSVRGMGYGFKLMTEFIKRVKESTGAESVMWRSEKTNIAGICLAIKLGGKEMFIIDDCMVYKI